MHTALRIAQGVHRGDFSATALVEDSLVRIVHFDADLQAWVLVDSSGARAAAQQMAVAGRREGALAGVPVGIKDIYDVAGLPTRAGAGSFAH
jgi:aspartyl-tRNA(Asn)/glutamyl-tRNA(Gln) amidotransferase subunit A